MQNIPQQAVDAFAQLTFSTLTEAHHALSQWLCRFLSSLSIATVCYRIVHGGNQFNQPVRLDSDVIQAIKSLIPLAPLHQPIGLDAIEVFMASFPDATHKACFDTAFHRSMPRVAQTFAIPKHMTAAGIKPYGFHGLSYHYIATVLPDSNDGHLPARVIIAHLGAGASMCALKDGKSIASTMTFTPLDGLPMATRCGAIDAGAVLYMASELKLTFAEISELLNQQSGLLGLSANSGDFRTLLSSNDKDALFAIEYFVYRACREMTSLMGALQGVDAIVFTGGVGANSSHIRQQICQQLSWLGIAIQADFNRANNVLISGENSAIKVFAINSDEEVMMASSA
ncbi:acetate/propionate family kinase [Aliiglaciecola litoralis]|uniref:Acetate kinase n=2 Tax=Aliiglaciecola litoralis TaxID=582857 RepID=A0ABP3X0Q3_9ALTE